MREKAKCDVVEELVLQRLYIYVTPILKDCDGLGCSLLLARLCPDVAELPLA